MLWVLYIENIAVAKQMEIRFGDGFTALTGRTGAGKSIIIDSLLLLCGARFDKDLIRSGEDHASVSGIFVCDSYASEKLSEMGYDTDESGEIQLIRQITSDGRSSAKINRKPIPISSLREIAPVLLEIQTQNERNSYTDKEQYTDLLDRYASDEAELGEYKTHYSQLCAVRGQIERLKKDMSKRDMMLDILKYQKKEIDSAKLTSDDEEEKLLKLRLRLRSMEKVSKYSQIVTKALAYSEKGATADYLLERAQSALSELSGIVDGADDMASRLGDFRYEIVDIAERVKDAVGDDIADPVGRLTQVETRLSYLEKLKGKYGETIAEIKAKRSEIAEKIADLEDGDFRLREYEAQEALKAAQTANAASCLSKKRTEAAKILAENIVKTLQFLDMPRVRFRIAVNCMKDARSKYIFRDNGYDDVDFLISVNIGEDMQSLGKVSSGGEMSRITLAIKSAFADKYNSGAIIFDEIDAGVSGGTSERIGIMLKKLAENTQVIAVTHSPQIASIASRHLLIEKGENKDRTESSVREITGDERVDEIARIIGGISVTEKQTAAAREMLKSNDN